MRLECAQAITEIKDKYNPENTSDAALENWIYTCLFNALSKQKFDPKPGIKYLDCLLDFHSDLLIFNIFKKPVVNLVTGKDDGCFYDVSILSTTHFKKFFGTTDIAELKQTVSFSPIDILDISNSIAEEIRDWCTNIEDIFQVLQMNQ
jgi:hypothetical protein